MCTRVDVGFCNSARRDVCSALRVATAAAAADAGVASPLGDAAGSVGKQSRAPNYMSSTRCTMLDVESPSTTLY